MPAIVAHRRRLPGLLLAAFCLVAGIWGGCGGSTEIMELPENAKKGLIQKKIDIRAREGKSAKAGKTATRATPIK
jgi:hypothetical protein